MKTPFLPCFALALATTALLPACHSPGHYGFSASYAPLDDEEGAVRDARSFDPVMYQREPESWRNKPTTLFGVVTNRAAGPGGRAYVTLTVRTLEPRNLCRNANDEETCRTTVSDKDFGVVHALVALRPEDDIGERSLGGASLVRLVGTFVQDADATDGAPVLRATFYRHWPRNYYVTRANAETMRQ